MIRDNDIKNTDFKFIDIGSMDTESIVRPSTSYWPDVWMRLKKQTSNDLPDHNCCIDPLGNICTDTFRL